MMIIEVVIYRSCQCYIEKGPWMFDISVKLKYNVIKINKQTTAEVPTLKVSIQCIGQQI